MRRRRPVVLVVVALGATLVASPASARPPQPTCGETLTRSTTLLADLVCTTAPGLRLAPGVTLDLGGHTLRGPGSGNGLDVAWSGPVVVRNGTITGWGTGVDTWADVDPDADPEAEAGPLTVTRVTFEGSGRGIDASGESGTGRFRKTTTIDRSVFRGLDQAIQGDWFAEVAVDRSTFADNRIGLWTEGAATVTDSTFARHRWALRATEASLDVAGSTFVDNETAVGPIFSAAASVDGSRFDGNGVAVDTSGSFVMSVRASRFTANDRAVSLGGYGEVLVEGNVLRGNRVAIGSTAPDALSEATVVDNTLRLNGDGIVLDDADASVRVGGNDVRRSTGWGIYAPGVTDLGGNVARGNGSDPQCVGVVCTAS